MRQRFLVWVVVAVAGFAAVVVAQQPEADRGHVHRDGFAGREPAWVAGATNMKVTERDHRIVANSYFNAPSSEYLKVEAQPASNKADAEFVYYTYDTPACPVQGAAGEEPTASVWVKSFRSGIQLRARVVLPKERDPKAPETPLTTVIVGDTYPDERIRSWHRLTIGKPADALRKQLPVLRAQLGREIDPAGAYIDQLILNVYAGPGINEVWIDDLDIGPCTVDPKKPLKGIGRPVSRTKTPGKLDAPPGTLPNGVAHPYSVEFVAGRILIDKKPFFMRAVRHAGQSLKGLRDFNFNTIAFPANVDAALVDDAVVNNSFMVLAEVPVVGSGDPGSETPISVGRDADRLIENFRRFRSGDGVLLWDLGAGRTTEQLRSVARTSESIREYDPRRPRGVDLWDGYSAYSEHLDVIGSHRWPLFTSLELDKYREWLLQRRALTSPGKLMWTWIQTHMPEWYLALATGKAKPGHLDSPLGPQPEQIRLLTYLGLASGYRGLGFWTDEFLTPDLAASNSSGRDRMIELYLLNTELELLEPVLFGVEDEKTMWVPTNNFFVKAAVLRGKRGIIVLPVWVGPQSQFCMDQGSMDGLKITVPLVPDGADPWLLTPANYENLRATGGVRSVPGGVEVTIPKFDLTAAIVFTSDLTPDGLVVRWQDNIRNGSAKRAAQLAIEQAKEIYEKVHAVHEQLAGVAPPVRGADELFAQARLSIERAVKAMANNQPDVAYRDSRTALRPVRVLMREHWKNATVVLSTPTSSPYAVSFYTLPQHWELARRIQGARPGGNLLRYGDFELSVKAPEEGAAVNSLPGWTTRETHLDAVKAGATIINVSDVLRGGRKESDPVPPGAPNLGRHCLRLLVTAVIPKDEKNPKEFRPPTALERVSLAVDTPAVALPPGSWARVSFWALSSDIKGSADGALVFDSVGSEPLAVRLEPFKWKQYYLYRQVKADGKLAVTFALTGIGFAFFDDVRIEPMELPPAAGR
ncbi:hypothetical protein [Limnoglobus roseus]|uniref:Uncharacterized protein n=1 Tax=Limnoglobus roseus TaxID=2598579 RepID=A0A5C1A936_9BACT|nr:hypothetical protein [Limnoglobus roseus]QEL14556.1 hypothetical protein PX52LOC_01446 [Limnoglobus roseus]